MTSLGLNLFVAVVWLLLSADPSPASFAIGGLMGFALLAALPDLLGSRDYVRRVLALLRFGLVFTREFIVSNVTVAKLVLSRDPTRLRPDFIAYDTTGMRPYEILLLSYCLTLTPGTTSVEMSEDFRTLMIHALDADDPDAVRASLDRTLKHGILAFTR